MTQIGHPIGFKSISSTSATLGRGTTGRRFFVLAFLVYL
jgi:hypothetical protein